MTSRHSLFALTAIALAAATHQPAAAQATGVQNVSSGLCMGVSGASNQPGTAIIQWGCNGSLDQRWKLVERGDYYALRDDKSELCLGVPYGSDDAGVGLIQWRCDGSTNQQYVLRPQGDGFALMARHSKKCVGVDNGSNGAGARIEQQVCDHSDNQTWRMTGVAAAARKGAWGPKKTLSIVPVSAANLPNGDVMFWSGIGKFSFSGGDSGRTYTSLYDFDKGTFKEDLVNETDHEMFCPGIANLSDGRIHVSGGSSAKDVSIYDWRTKRWTRSGDLNNGRGYHASATMEDGDVFVIGGSWPAGEGNNNGEVWSDNTNRWRNTPNLKGADIATSDRQGIYRADNHAWLFTAPGGRLFHAGPRRDMHWIDTDGNGRLTDAGRRGGSGDDDMMNGNAVMYGTNRILVMGGAADYEGGTATRTAFSINISNTRPDVDRVGPMKHARAYHNSVVLPNGEVFVVGGMTKPQPFVDSTGVLEPELFEPSRGKFVAMAQHGTPRNYHSVALLLPDARVISGGGGLCGGCSTNHPDVQIWSPPYLFRADGGPARRPKVVAAAATARVGSDMRVRTDSFVTGFSLVRLSSVTHSVNNEQRRIGVGIRYNGNNDYTLDLPTSPGVLVPGYYMLFAINEAGTPSMAHTVRITR